MGKVATRELQLNAACTVECQCFLSHSWDAARAATATNDAHHAMTSLKYTSRRSIKHIPQQTLHAMHTQLRPCTCDAAHLMKWSPQCLHESPSTHRASLASQLPKIALISEDRRGWDLVASALLRRSSGPKCNHHCGALLSSHLIDAHAYFVPWPHLTEASLDWSIQGWAIRILANLGCASSKHTDQEFLFLRECVWAQLNAM